MRVDLIRAAAIDGATRVIRRLAVVFSRCVHDAIVIHADVIIFATNAARFRALAFTSVQRASSTHAVVRIRNVAKYARKNAANVLPRIKVPICIARQWMACKCGIICCERVID